MPMASSDPFVVYIRSSLDMNFALLVSSDDDISSLKKKAEAQYLALFPEKGGIVARAIKIMQQGAVYSLGDSIPVHCLFDRTEGIRFLLMDAVAVPSNLAETSQNGTHKGVVFSQDMAVVGVLSREGEENLIGGEKHVSSERQSQDEASRGRDLNEGSLNQGDHTRCTSEVLKRKSLEGSTNRDPVVEEMAQGVGVLGEYAECNTKQKKSNDPSPDEVPPSSESEPTRARDKMLETSAAFENGTADLHLMNSPLVTGNPGETSSLAPSGSGAEDSSMNKIKSSRLTDLKDKGNEIGRSQNNSKSTTDFIVASDKKKRQTSEKVQSDSRLVDDPVSEDKKSKRKQDAAKPDDSTLGEQGKKRLKRAVQKSPTKRLAEKFDISKSDVAGNGSSSTDAKEVFTNGVGVSSPDVKGKKQKDLTVMVPEELRCHKSSGRGWRCSEKALMNQKYCSHHCRKPGKSKLSKELDIGGPSSVL